MSARGTQTRLPRTVLTVLGTPEGAAVFARYQIRIAERLDQEITTVFEGLEIAFDGETTVISGDLDQAALHGLLERVRMLGLELVEARRVPDTTGQDVKPSPVSGDPGRGRL